MKDNILFGNQAKKLFDYNQFPIKIFTGVRGSGKTYPTHEFLLNRYLYHNEFFVCVRETQEEVDNMLAGAFWDSYLLDLPQYKGHEYKCSGNKIIIDGLIVGYAVALSTYGKFRGAVSPVGGHEKRKSTKRDEELKQQIEEMEEFVGNNIERTTSAFFDEFIPLTPRLSDQKRLDGFLHFLETVFRFRKRTNVILCGNITKPYDVFLEEFNFPQPLNIQYGIQKSYTRKEEGTKIEPLAVWCHLQPNKEWLKARQNSIVGKITRGKNRDMFSSGMAFINTDVKYIMGRPLPRRVLFNISDGDNDITLWRAIEKEDLFYVTERTSGRSYNTYVCDIKNCRNGKRLITKYLEDQIVDGFEKGLFEFENAKVFEIFQNILPVKRNRR